MNKKQKYIVIGATALLLFLVAALIVSLVKYSSSQRTLSETKMLNEQLKLDTMQLRLTNQVAAIDAEFRQRETDAIKLENDTIQAKYNEAKNRIDELIKQLNAEKTKNADQIQKLQNEVNTLRGLLKHYIAQIDSLNKENAQLREENQGLTDQNRELTSQVAEVRRQNDDLNEIKTLAEKLTVTTVSLTAVNNKNKSEKKLKKVKQLKVTFTIAPNNTAPTGNKTIYLRLTNPMGDLLGQSGTFSFEGASVAYTEKKSIEYDGAETTVTMYWNNNATLTAGKYRVEIFADNFRISNQEFQLPKK